jgi:predicted 3-demethylubiquinone-9 3-methyltransferase (glyoxalase superfamily)
MVQSVQPFLMFQGDAEEALTFYTSLIPDSRIEAIARYGPGESGPEGTVMEARFTLAGQSVICIDSPVEHEFDFTPSFSFFVICSDDVEIRRLASALLNGGEVLMALDDYGFSRLFAWVRDRFGVSWQLSLP